MQRQGQIASALVLLYETHPRGDVREARVPRPRRQQIDRPGVEIQSDKVRLGVLSGEGQQQIAGPAPEVHDRRPPFRSARTEPERRRRRTHHRSEGLHLEPLPRAPGGSSPLVRSSRVGGGRALRPVDESQTRRVVLARPHAVERAPTLAPRFVVPPPVVVVVVVVTVVTVVRRVSLDGPPRFPRRAIVGPPQGMGPHQPLEPLLQRGGVALFTSASLPPVVRASFRASPHGGFVLAAAAAVVFARFPALVFLDRDPRAGPQRPAVDVRAVERRGGGAPGVRVRELQHREPPVELALVAPLPLVDAGSRSPARHRDGRRDWGRGRRARERGGEVPPHVIRVVEEVQVPHVDVPLAGVVPRGAAGSDRRAVVRGGAHRLASRRHRAPDARPTRGRDAAAGRGASTRDAAGGCARAHECRHRYPRAYRRRGHLLHTPTARPTAPQALALREEPAA